MTVYDSLGNSRRHHVLQEVLARRYRQQLGVVRGRRGGLIQRHYRGPGSGTVSFNSSGSLYSESSTTYPVGGFDFTGGAAQDQVISFDFGTSIVQGGTGTDGTTQYATSSGVSPLHAGRTLRLARVDQHRRRRGRIRTFSNGKELTLAEVILADSPIPGWRARARTSIPRLTRQVSRSWERPVAPAGALSRHPHSSLERRHRLRVRLDDNGTEGFPGELQGHNHDRRDTRRDSEPQALNVSI